MQLSSLSRQDTDGFFSNEVTRSIISPRKELRGLLVSPGTQLTATWHPMEPSSPKLAERIAVEQIEALFNAVTLGVFSAALAGR